MIKKITAAIFISLICNLLLITIVNVYISKSNSLFQQIIKSPSNISISNKIKYNSILLIQTCGHYLTNDDKILLTNSKLGMLTALATCSSLYLSPLLVGMGLHINRDNYISLTENFYKATVFMFVSDSNKENVEYGDIVSITSNDLFINNADVFCKLTSNKHTFRLIPPTNDLLGKVMHYGDPVYIDNMSYMLGNNFDTTYYIGNTDRPAAFYMQPAYAPLMSLGSQIYNSKYSNNDKTFLRILAYNIWMLPDFLGHIIKSSPNKLERSDGIIKLISTIDPDVLVITEVFDNPTRKSILNKLKMYGYYFETPCVGINQKSGAINGGIIVISKYQIITSKQEVFRSSCSDDYLANKGIIYVKLMINNTSYHIFGVHMQAWESDTCITTRKDQLNQLLEFASKQNINSNDVVIYAGDFNIDKYSDKTNNEYTDMINKLNVTDPQKYNMTPTIDSQRNKLANGSTVSNIGKSEIVDYILVSNEHKKINVIKNGIIRPKLDSNDLSDHYPIFIDIDLDTNYK